MGPGLHRFEQPMCQDAGKRVCECKALPNNGLKRMSARL